MAGRKKIMTLDEAAGGSSSAAARQLPLEGKAKEAAKGKAKETAGDTSSAAARHLPLEGKAKEAAKDTKAKSRAVIAVGRVPVIREALAELRVSWEAKAKEAEGIVCTAENAAALKSRRAGLRRDFEALDVQRREARARYMQPWEALERAWDENVGGFFRQADSAYKEAVGGFEDALKADCLSDLAAWFACESSEAGAGWLDFPLALEKSGVKIGLTEARSGDTAKAREALDTLLERVRQDVEAIAEGDDGAAVLAEYMRSLDKQGAAGAVKERREREEKARALLEREKGGREVFPEIAFRVFGCTKLELGRIRDALGAWGIRYE